MWWTARERWKFFIAYEQNNKLNEIHAMSAVLDHHTNSSQLEQCGQNLISSLLWLFNKWELGNSPVSFMVKLLQWNWYRADQATMCDALCDLTAGGRIMQQTTTRTRSDWICPNSSNYVLYGPRTPTYMRVVYAVKKKYNICVLSLDHILSFITVIIYLFGQKKWVRLDGFLATSF